VLAWATDNHLRYHLPESSRVALKSIILVVLLIANLSVPGTILAQATGRGDGVRFGLSLGGISTVGATVEFFSGSRSIDLTLGTWSFHELSVSAVAKQYVGEKAARPFVGAGLWMVFAAPGNDRIGAALIARVPVGVDWTLADRHALGAVVNLNRGLWVRRADQEDEVPMNKRLVPLPELYYRFTS